MIFEKYIQRRQEKRQLFEKKKKQQDDLDTRLVDAYDGLLFFPGSKTEFEDCFGMNIEIVDVYGQYKFISACRTHLKNYDYANFSRRNADAGQFMLDNEVIGLIHYVSESHSDYFCEGTGIPIRLKR